MDKLSSARNTSIINTIITIFTVAMLVTIIGIGTLIFSNWYSSAGKTTESIAEDMNDTIYGRIYSYMHLPEQINEANNKIIKNGILDLSDDEHRDKFFAGVLSSYGNDIYSFSYGTSTGEYYGARRNEAGEIEVMRNNDSTGGNTWYYSLNDDFSLGELKHVSGKFDPRTRAWYTSAMSSSVQTFSPIYKHFVMNDLTVSSALPLYDDSGKLTGVLGTHMLLSGISDYLSDVVKNYSGQAYIIERGTGSVVANSVGADSFTILPDGNLKLYSLTDIKNPALQEAYEKYISTGDPHFLFWGENGQLYINVREIHFEGLNWAVITAIPRNLLVTNLLKSIHLAALLSVLALLTSFLIYTAVTRRLLKPMSSLLRASEALTSGDFSKRVNIERNDEIGIISAGFNHLADKVQYLVGNLENTVNERTELLHSANETLEEKKNELQLILDTAAEAIYGVNLEGNCTFCNISCITMLGYKSSEDLLGKNMHAQIHYSHPDGTPFLFDDCEIIVSMRRGEGYHSDDSVFWKADGTSFFVEYQAQPQIINGKVVGAVITFTDITERKMKEEEIQYLSCHDILTGLYNRRCFEGHRAKIDTPDHLPLSIIFADINGLKLTNDIFGHAAGDELIKKASETLLESCGDKDFVARVGGDEFIILLPNTDTEKAQQVMSKIRSSLKAAQVSAVKCSISMGCDSKLSPEQSFEEIMSNAENAMYKDKTINRKSIDADIIDTIVETLHSKYPNEKQHSVAVSRLCGELGVALGLPDPQIKKLGREGFLHDIGKIVLDDDIFYKDKLSVEEYEKIQQHSVIGYRILNLFDDTLDLAEDIYSHHERWDGKGYPRGLSGEGIPILSRIISIVEAYDRVLSRGNYELTERKQRAVQAIKDGAGRQFDPQIAEIFIKLMEAKDN